MKKQIAADQWNFDVDYIAAGLTPIRIGGAARLTDFVKFKAMRELLVPDNGLNGPYHNDPTKSHCFSVKGPPTDPKIQYAITELEKLGWSPVFQGMAGPDQRDRHYPITRSRPDYSLDSSNWLMLMDAGGDGGMILNLEGDDLVVITRPSWAKKKSHCLNILWCELAVSQHFKDSYEAAGLTGAVFHPITYVPSAPGFHPRLYPDKPLPSCNRLYWMDSTVVAPWSHYQRRLLLGVDNPLRGTLLGHSNAPLVGQRGELGFDNEGYVGCGIDYSRSEMDAMEGVDFMRMAEWMCERNGVWRSYHIISQRFRKWAHKFGCRFRMNGVKLVD